MGGALEWNCYPQNAIYRHEGRTSAGTWTPSRIYDPDDIYKAGIMMGFQSERRRRLHLGLRPALRQVRPDGPRSLQPPPARRLRRLLARDGSDAQNGHYFLRVASSDHVRPDGKHVRTVRDVIIEVDPNGPGRRRMASLRTFSTRTATTFSRSLDQGAVCLNIDARQAGKTLSAEELAEAGPERQVRRHRRATGAGRNWAARQLRRL